MLTCNLLIMSSCDLIMLFEFLLKEKHEEGLYGAV